jgi:antagonist of KipI
VTAALHVVKRGLLTTVQDLGRPHAIASGVTPGGAMDRFAHSAANLLVGNDRGAATLECTVRGPVLAAQRPCRVAVTGADLELAVNGAEAPTWTTIRLEEGDTLSFGSRRSGARAYVAVGGGVVADRWLGSMSTNLKVARGGMHGRALREGDVIHAADQVDAPPPGRSLAEGRRPVYTDHALHAIAGPHRGPTIFDTPFVLSPDSDRMGYRLQGRHVEAGGDELLSFVVVAGAVQVPSGGGPILLMADHQTAGGYPVVAVVAGASLPVAAQLAPGDEVRFVETSIEAALAMRAAQREALDSLSSWDIRR